MSFKILLVEHDAACAERIGEALRGAGHQLYTEADTAKVLESLDRLRPDVALVADGLPDMPGAALCMRLKKSPTGSTTPVVFMTAKLPQDEEELARRQELLGCERIIDEQTTSEQLLEICRQLVGRETEVKAKSDAPERRPEGQVITQELPKVGKHTNRDSSSAASFDDAMRSAFTDASSPSDGLDIEAHLDSVFSMGLPGDKPAPAPAPAKGRSTPKAASPAETGATRELPVVPPVVNTPATRPSETKPAAPKAVAPKPAAPAKPAVAPRPAAAPTSATVPASPKAQPATRPAEAAQPVARQAPKAVEQLRLPRVPEIAPEGQSTARRWLWPVAGLVGATVVVGSLAVGYLVFLGGSEEPNETPQVARASMALPSPKAEPAAPVPVVEEDSVEAEPLPEPPPLDDATPTVDPGAPAESAPKDEAPVKVVSAPPKPKPRAETPQAPKKTGAPPTKTASTAAAVAATAIKVDPPPQPEPKTTVAPRTETAASDAGASTDPPVATTEKSEPKVVAPPPVPVPEAAPPETPEVAQAEPEPEPQPAAAPPVAAEPVVVPPEVLQRVEPSYSAKAVKGLDNPMITLRVLVDQQGKIARVLVEEGIPGSELEGAAISAVLRWRFRPATEDGVPVKAWTMVRFVFKK